LLPTHTPEAYGLARALVDFLSTGAARSYTAASLASGSSGGNFYRLFYF